MGPTASTASSEADDVRATERERIRALVNGDLEVARQLHADDFQLVTPLGVVFSKEQYLGAVAVGDLHYLVCEFESPIEVRMYSEVALIRYQSQIEIVVQGQKYPRARYWHTDAYEKRGGRWQVVWSQATAIA
jgi:hypothetical protein